MRAVIAAGEHVPGDPLRRRSCTAFSGRDAEQPRRGSAQDRDPFVVGEPRRVGARIDLGAGPRERVVGADHDLAGAGFRDQVA